MSNNPQLNTLEVGGARLYYEVRGTGDAPLLLMIPGGGGDTEKYNDVSHALSNQFKVVTYDRRGFSRSELVGTQDYEHRLDTDVDDAKQLIEHLTDKPVFVFGSSSGAIIALALLIRHPSIIRALIAHEPPAFTLLPDTEKWRQLFGEVYQLYTTAGIWAAMGKFASLVISEEEMKSLRAVVNRNNPYLQPNSIYWMEHELRQYAFAVLDISTLDKYAGRLVLAGGETSSNCVPSQPNQVLAKKYGVEVLILPGGHTGYAQHPVEFANQLQDALKQRRLIN